MNLLFKVASSEAEKEAVLDMRKKIFVEEQGIPAALDNDGKDQSSLHVMAFNHEGVLVASGRLTIENSEGVLSRIAVAQEFRGLSLGKQIVRELEAIAKANNLTSLCLRPHAYLEKFYLDLGYQTQQNGEHQVGKYTLLLMVKQLAR